jgi:hypothetical protein
MAILSTVPSTWGSEASPWGSYTATGTVTAGAVTLGAGWWFVICGAHNTVQQIYNPGTASASAIAASGAGMVFSDGTNTVILNDSTGGTAAHYAKLLLDTA